MHALFLSPLLLLIMQITEEGVTFQSPVDGTQMLLTPEMSIQHQVRFWRPFIYLPAYLPTYLWFLLPLLVILSIYLSMYLSSIQTFHTQNRIGSDIMMQLDDVVSSVADDDARFTEAMDRSIRWLDRCIKVSEWVRVREWWDLGREGGRTNPVGEAAVWPGLCLAHHITHSLMDICMYVYLQAHSRPKAQNLFGIIQGGLDTSPGGLREVSGSFL